MSSNFACAIAFKRSFARDGDGQERKTRWGYTTLQKQVLYLPSEASEIKETAFKRSSRSSSRLPVIVLMILLFLQPSKFSVQYKSNGLLLLRLARLSTGIVRSRWPRIRDTVITVWGFGTSRRLAPSYFVLLTPLVNFIIGWKHEHK